MVWRLLKKLTKWFFILLFACVAILLVSQLFGIKKLMPIPETELLPEIEAVFKELPTQEALMKNAYAGLLGIQAMEGEAFQQLGAKYIQDSYNYWVEQVLREQSTNYLKPHGLPTGLEIINKTDHEKANFVLPCARNIGSKRCVADILLQKEDLQLLIEKNQTLLQRYDVLKQLPTYREYHYATPIFEGSPYYSPLILASNLQLAQAVMAFYESRPDEGFLSLQDELDFLKKWLTGHSRILDKLMLRLRFFAFYNTLASLMSQPEFAPYMQDPRMLALLAPFTPKEQAAIGDALEAEALCQSYSGLLFPYIYREDTLPDWAPIKFYPLFSGIHINESSNIYYLASLPAVERGRMPMDEVSALYVQKALPNLQEITQNALLQEKNRWNSDHWLGINFWGFRAVAFGLSLDADPSDGLNHQFLNRWYDLQTYMQMVRVKYVMLSQGIVAEDMPKILNALNADGKHPLTQQPFDWDPEVKTLSTPWLHHGDGLANDREAIQLEF